MIIRNHKIVLEDTSASEMARFRKIMLDIWRQQIEDDKNAVEMENFIKQQYRCENKIMPKDIAKREPIEEISLRGKYFDENNGNIYKPINIEVLENTNCKNYTYICDSKIYTNIDGSKNSSSGNDYEIDSNGNVKLKRTTKNNFDRLYKESKLIGKTNKGALGQLEGKNIFESDFNEIKFKNRADLNSFFDLTIKIQYAYDKEVSALMVGKRTENLNDLRTKTYDLLLVGLKYSIKRFIKNDIPDGYSNFLPELMKNIDFEKTTSCLNLGAKYYDIAGFYHTHPIGGPEPSGNTKIENSGDLYIYNKYNLPGYLRGTNGWSVVGPDGKGIIQYDPADKIKIFEEQ